MTQVQDALQDVEAVSAELVAKTIAGIPLIGQARRVLERDGWVVTIVANRITVAGTVEAQLVSSNGHGWWQVYAADGRPPVWTVDTQCEDASRWDGFGG